MRVAIAQTQPVSAAPGKQALSRASVAGEEQGRMFPALERNLQDVVRAVEDAKRGDAEVVVFCEYFLQGILNEHRQVSTVPGREVVLIGLPD